MAGTRVFLGLDVGERRIGLACADSIGRIAQPLATLAVDGTEAAQLQGIIASHDITELVVGRPRNLSGAPTAQTASVEAFSRTILEPLSLPLHWQDESVTSVMAEERLNARKKPYTKADIDAEAACIILQDYLEQL